MLKLHGGRENVDKEKFVYENILGETLVLVPNQYTLTAEEQALEYTGKTCLFDIEILSMNRLGMRLLKEQGVENKNMLSRVGRTMLLSKLIREHEDELDIFRRSAGKSSFTNMIADFISEFKQNSCTLQEVLALQDKDDVNPILKGKLQEIGNILNDYEDALKGSFTDAEDYIAMYVDAISSSEYIKGKNIWIYGYDSITPKFLRAVLELAKRANDVHFILNQSDYGLDEAVETRFLREASNQGIDVSVDEISNAYEISRCDAIKKIERCIANPEDEICKESCKESCHLTDEVTLVECANTYSEAENAAVYVKKLVREEGYRLSDIAVICNDKDKMQPIVKRIFGEYGIEVFLDSSRSITDSAPVCFIASLLTLMVYPYSTKNILSMLKTGFSGLDKNVIERLELYVQKYKIRGTMWRSPFKYGLEEYGEEAFGELNQAREYIAARLDLFEVLLRNSKTIREWTSEFKNYLEEVWNFSVELDSFIRLEEKTGFLDDASRAKGSAVESIKVIDQLEQIMGDDAFDGEAVYKVLLDGLTSVQVGMIPPSVDGISMGTMIRTRPGRVKAVLVLGANEGSLPLEPSTEGLFSVDEKKYFKENEFALGSLDDIKMTEENTAIYRILSKATDKLYISYSIVDTENKTLVPSSVVDSIKSVFPGIEVKQDVVSRGFAIDLVEHEFEAMRHLVNHLKDKNVTKMDALTAALLDYFENKDKDAIARLLKVACDENAVSPLGVELSNKVFAGKNGDYRLSASSIQNYKECPFRFFVDKGLSPVEERTFESDARSIGDIYHECLMSVGKRIIAGDEKDTQTLVNEELDRISSEYREGLFVSTKTEEYRLARIKEICLKAAEIVRGQIKSEKTKQFYFEEGFGRGKTFPALEFEVDGQSVRVEGKIDRVDILDGDRARVIDYKTGGEILSKTKLKQGYKMQLMIYSMAVTSGEYEPEGIYYFNISDMEENASDFNREKLEKLLEPNEFEDMSSGLELAKIGPEEYTEIRDSVDENIREISSGIIHGDIRISPLKSATNRLVCEYCKYKAICRYDASAYAGNRSREE